MNLVRPAAVRGTAGWRRAVLPVAGIVLAFAVFVASDSSVSAHAELVGTNPLPGEVLPQQPQSVVLTFNEPVNPVDRQFRLFDSAQAVTTLESEKSGNNVIVPLPGELSTGSYVLAWRVISADGHPISGALPFAIGAQSGTEIAVTYAEADSWVHRLLGLLNGVTYVCFLAVVGLLWFRHMLDTESPVRTVAVATLLGIGLFAMALAVPVTVARQQAETAKYLFSSDWIANVSTDAWVALALAAIGAGVLLVATRQSKRQSQTALLAVGPLLLLGSLSVVGHTRIVDPRALIVLSNVMHVIAGAIWLGGLVGLILVFRRKETAERTARKVAGFSLVAAIALAGVLISGVVSSVLIVRSFSALIETSYGQLLLVKIGLVLIVCGLGAWNRFRLVPIVTRDAEEGIAFGRLRRIVLAEASLLIVVALVTGFLVNLSPRVAATEAPTHMHEQHPTIALEIPAGSATATGELGHLSNRRYTLTINIVDDEGAAIIPHETPSMTMTLESLEIGPLPVTLRSNSDGSKYTAIVDFPFPGEWTMAMSVRLSTFDSANGQTTVTVP